MVRQYCQQKSDDPVYIFRVLIAKRPFFVVLTTKEVKASKINPESSYSTMGDTESDRKIKAIHKGTILDKETQLLISTTRSYLRYRKGESKLEEIRAKKASEGAGQ